MVRAIWRPQVAALGAYEKVPGRGGGGSWATLTYTRQQGVTLVSTRRPRATPTCGGRPRVTLSLAKGDPGGDPPGKGRPWSAPARPRVTLSLDGRPRVTLTSAGR